VKCPQVCALHTLNTQLPVAPLVADTIRCARFAVTPNTPDMVCAAVFRLHDCADPLPLEEMYTQCGVDELQLPPYQCHRGTSAEEGMHGHLNKLFKGGNYGVETAQVRTLSKRRAARDWPCERPTIT